MADTPSKLNIYQRLALVASDKDVAYIKKTVESGSGSAKGVGRDFVMATVRKPLLDAGIYFSTSQVGPGYVNFIPRPVKEGQDQKEPAVLYTAMYATTFFNVDDPKDFHVVQHEAHGKDFGDKAPGKASTYAEKLNIIKGLGIETGINDEMRFPGDYEEDHAPKPGKEPIKPPQEKAAQPAPEPTKSSQAPAAAEPASPAAAGTDFTTEEQGKRIQALIAAKGPEAKKRVVQAMKNAKAGKLTAIPAAITKELIPSLERLADVAEA